MTHVPCLLDGIYDHPRIGWPTSRADDEGPGAPAESLAAERLQPEAATAGAPVPDDLKRSEAIAAYILHYARAC